VRAPARAAIVASTLMALATALLRADGMPGAVVPVLPGIILAPYRHPAPTSRRAAMRAALHVVPPPSGTFAYAHHNVLRATGFVLPDEVEAPSVVTGREVGRQGS